MMRSQSPGYPNAPLPKAIQSVRQIFDADRRNPIERDLAAKHIGYSGSSGAADKAIATLAHYGLTEKVGKGEIRVSQLALDIIHPNKPEDRPRALLQAGFNPQIFKDLRERFPEGHVSEGALESYLKRENFLDRAITPVTKAYLETCRFLEQEKAFESRGNATEKGEESVSLEDDEVDTMEAPTAVKPVAAHPAASPFVAAMTSAVENDIKIMLDGDYLRVSAFVDLKGAKRLMKALRANMALLEDDDEDEDLA
jgi:hypothetical protein